MIRILKIFFIGLIIFLVHGLTPAKVVINEIYYHPDGDLPDIEFIELYNCGSGFVSLADWAFTDGIEFTFPAGAMIAPDEYIVVANNRLAVSQFYGISLDRVFGDYGGRLSNSGERVALSDDSGLLIDEVEYDDAHPWPMTPDGDGPSLELIYSCGENDNFRYWRASNPGTNSQFGTPGRQNSVASDLPVGPAIIDVGQSPTEPTSIEAVDISISVLPPSPQTVTVTYEAIGGAGVQQIEASYAGLNNGAENWTATIPPHSERTLVRYFAETQHIDYSSSIWPEQAPDYQLGYRVSEDAPSTSPLPAYYLYIDQEGMDAITGDPWAKERVPARLAHEGRLYDDIRAGWRGNLTLIYPKKAWKALFRKGNYLRDEVKKLNLKAMWLDSSLLYEKLTLEVFEERGHPVPYCEPVRLYLNDEFYGVMMEYEEPDEAYLERNGMNPDGWLVKTNYFDVWYFLAWKPWLRLQFYEAAVGGKDGPEDYIEGFVRGLNLIPPTELSAFIENNLQTDAFIDYLVARALCSWYDNEFANRMAYKDPNGADNRWRILVWDADHSFGWNADYNEWEIQPPLFYNMPPMDPTPPIRRINPLFLYAEGNSEWRDVFYTRLADALQTTFTEEKLFPRIDELMDLIEADALADPNKKGDNAVFLSERQRLKDFVTERRRWLLEFEIPTEILRSIILGRRTATMELIEAHDENNDGKLDTTDLFLLMARLGYIPPQFD